jgi:hypothetical protein
MPNWTLSIDLAPEVEAWRMGNLSIEELARRVVGILKASGWRAFSPYPHTWDDTVDRLLQVDSPAAYETAFNYIYDLADQDRVWIQTN